MPWFAFHNNYTQLVSVAVMQFDPDACGGEGGNWASHGWWNLNPGETKTAIWTKYDTAYFYGEAGDGSWWGNENGPRVYVNPYDRFDSCYAIGHSTWDIAEMEPAYLGSFLYNTHTVSFNP
jgi:uncharacterized membrane protein